ncbi:MAG TPA: NAD(P)H-hydrate dehydratase [Gemmatimonadaceae bacterium]|nr:NAD(P)H-hydrate dehydratase [Gemmatimonadaceae bacterium]
MAARVASAAEAMAWERATIESGTPATELMNRAGIRAADEIATRLPGRAARGVVVMTGPGNNGGDGWVIARSLAEKQIPVRVVEVSPARTGDAISARATASRTGVPTDELVSNPIREAVVVDALLGTGSSGAPKGRISEGVRAINRAANDGATVVAVDLPTGLDATTGAHNECVNAHMSIAFGTVKRGHLISRDMCGAIIAVDIGFLENTAESGLPLLIDAEWVRSRIPAISFDAHKGTRRSVAIIGGAKGMAGAAILAGEGALRAGAGLLRLVVDPVSALAVHAGIPAAIVNEWPEDADSLSSLLTSVDAIAIGPGLGRSEKTRHLVERLLLAWSGPVVLDADALNVFEGDVKSLSTLIGGRNALITPHAAEAARLMGVPVTEVLADRFDMCANMARILGASVLLKGTPTVAASAGGARFVSATGSAALATGGSGDVLTGIAVTLMAQMTARRSSDHPSRESSSDVAAAAGVCASFTHGRAAELCGTVRGTTLDDVLRALPAAWAEPIRSRRDGILTELGAVA